VMTSGDDIVTCARFGTAPSDDQKATNEISICWPGRAMMGDESLQDSLTDVIKAESRKQIIRPD
jgi:hypothetical protein